VEKVMQTGRWAFNERYDLRRFKTSIDIHEGNSMPNWGW
jgi:hypothetical protein